LPKTSPRHRQKVGTKYFTRKIKLKYLPKEESKEIVFQMKPKFKKIIEEK
jgi:hypothetical protein